MRVNKRVNYLIDPYFPTHLPIPHNLITTSKPKPTPNTKCVPTNSHQTSSLRVLGRYHGFWSVDNDRAAFRPLGNLFVALRADVCCLLEPVSEARDASQADAEQTTEDPGDTRRDRVSDGDRWHNNP